MATLGFVMWLLALLGRENLSGASGSMQYERLYPVVRINRSKCINAMYSHSTAANDISIEVHKSKSHEWEERTSSLSERIASSITTFAVNKSDMVGVVSLDQPS